MKKAFQTIAATLGFMGLATLVLFLLETTGSGTLKLPAGNLTADIASNDVVNTAPAGSSAQNETAIISPVAPTEGPVPAPATVPAADQATAAVTSPTPISPTEETNPSVSATPTPPPPVLVPLDDSGSIATSTAAIPSVTVSNGSPSSPPPPPALNIAGTAPEGTALALPYDESNFSNDTNWVATWGSTDVGWSGALDLTTGPGSTGGAVYLKNASLWANYQFDATVSWAAGRMFGLMADYHDTNNYVLCKYVRVDENTVTMRLEAYRGGSEVFLTPLETAAWSSSGTDVDVSMKVGGLYGTCSFAGTSISNSFIGPGRSPLGGTESGSVGFMVSDPVPNASQLIIKHVKVAS